MNSSDRNGSRVPKQILRAPNLLLCERKDIAEFTGVYRQYLLGQGATLAPVQIINLKNFDELINLLKHLEQHERIDTLQKIRVLADAGESTRQKQLRLETVKNQSFLRTFGDYEYFLFPGKRNGRHWSKGYLEDALAKALKRSTSEAAVYENLFNVTQDFLLSVNSCRGAHEHLINCNRHFLYAYLSGTEKFVGMSLGEAAKAGAFALDSDEFDGLKALLGKL